MNYIQRDAKDFPILKTLGYRKRKVSVCAAENVTLCDLNWSGGTRSEYRTFTLAGDAIGSAAKWNACAPWDNIAEGARIPLPSGAIVIRTGFFCGKESTATIYVNPSDMPRVLT